LYPCLGQEYISSSIIQRHLHSCRYSCADSGSSCGGHCICETCVPLGSRWW